MKTVNEIIKYYIDCKNILCQIKQYGENLEFETWTHSGIIHVNDAFELDTPNIHFEVMKYYVWWATTHYRFVLHNETKVMNYPKNAKLFDMLCAPIIFKACNRKYKKQGKQK